jgi:TRAP-type uncharacterized transport system fused permease subunit
MAVYDPALVLQTQSWLAVAYIFLKACVAIALWGAATIGFFWTNLPMVARVYAAATAFLFVVALPITDEVAFVMTGLFLLWQHRRRGVLAAATA